MLYGRSAEQAELTGVLDTSAGQRGTALALRGTVGVGRSALLDWASERARERGFRTLRVHGVEGESGLAYGGLSQLLLPLRDRIDGLPPPQAAALTSILGDGRAPEGDAYLHGLATLGLLTAAAEEQPVLCVVDDAHWLDSGTLAAVLFAARRLSADAVGMMFAVEREFDSLPGLRELTIPPLPTEEAERLLLAYDLGRPARTRVIAEAEGNPLALHELAVAGGRFGDVAGPLPVSELVAVAFRERLARVGERARVALLVAAAEGHGNLGIILTAARTLGVGPAELAEAERGGLVRVTGGRVLFDHPLVRNACYRAASMATRSSVHLALANASNVPNCWSYHLWSATTEPDEAVADRLWRAGELARERRAYADAAAQYEWSAKLTPDAGRQGDRLLRAATAALRAGQVEQAGELAEHAEPLLTGPADRVEIARLGAVVAADRDRPELAAGMLLRAVESRPSDGEHGPVSGSVAPSAAMLADAATYAWQAGSAELVRETYERANSIGRPDDTTQALAALVDGDGERALPLLATALRKATEHDTGAHGHGYLVPPAASALTWGVLLGDATSTLRLATTIGSRAREQGLIRMLPSALVAQGQAELWLGQPADAYAAVSEAVTIIEDTCLWRRTAAADGLSAQLAALSGDEDELGRALERLPAGSRPVADAAANQVDSGRRRYPEVVRRVNAWVSGRGGVGVPVPTAFGIASVADGVEAAVRTGRSELADGWLALLSDWAGANTQPWVLGLAARSRALVTDDEEAYLAAIHQHTRGDRPFERARSELSYGEWLRRCRRRSDARQPLSDAFDTFVRLRATPWVERCREELRTTGASLVADRELAVRPVDRLTPRELQVVRLAAGDASSEQIAARLFLSRRTVEHHLYRAYRKLGVGSRRELGRLEL